MIALPGTLRVQTDNGNSDHTQCVVGVAGSKVAPRAIQSSRLSDSAKGSLFLPEFERGLDNIESMRESPGCAGTGQILKFLCGKVGLKPDLTALRPFGPAALIILRPVDRLEAAISDGFPDFARLSHRVLIMAIEHQKRAHVGRHLIDG